MKVLLISDSESGQSLVEVIVAATALVFVLVAIVSGMILAVRNANFSNQQAVATKYTQEGIEMFRHFQQALGWETFYEEINNDNLANTFIYCLPTVIADPDPSNAADAFRGMTSGTLPCADIPSTAFSREIHIRKGLVTDPIVIDVIVNWVDGGRLNQSHSEAEFFPRFED